MLNVTSANVVQLPSGKFGFTGAVPAILAFDFEDENDLKIALISGPGIAAKIAKREGRVFATRTWDTAEAALQAADELKKAVVP